MTAEQTHHRDVPVPDRLRHRPRTREGYVIPWFVATVGDKPDFRVVSTRAMLGGLRDDQCFMCGEKMGRFATFAVGPMCTINRISPEPPSHRECIRYALQVCPFLTRPSMIRRPVEDGVAPAGMMIERNPGVIVEWTTREWTAQAVPAEHGGGILCNIGHPEEVTWWREGRTATRTEAVDAIASGFPILARAAKADGALALVQLGAQTHHALKLLPPGDGPTFGEAVERLGEALDAVTA